MALTAASALAAKPTPRSSYNDANTGVSIQTGDKNISTFGDGCPDPDSKYLFVLQHTIKVKKHGKFHFNGKIHVNTLEGKTLPKKHRLTINGRFVSRKKAKGSYRLRVKGCKKTKFTAVRDFTAPQG